MRSDDAAPRHAVFGCMHACRTEALPFGFVSLPCAGRLDLASLLLVFARGGAGAVILACGADECRHRGGGERACDHPAAKLVARARRIIGRAGLSPERVALRHLAPGDDVVALAEEHAETVAALGDWRGNTVEVPSAAEGASPVELSLQLIAAIEAQSDWAGTVTGSGETLLWPGCLGLRASLSGSGGSPDTALELMRLAGVHPMVAAPRCCGAPLSAAGEAGQDAFAVLARSNAELVARSGAKQVVTACPHCARAMTEAYPGAGAALDVPVVDVASWAAPRLDLESAAGAVVLAGSSSCGDAAALAPLASGETLSWPDCEGALRGPRLRRTTLELLDEATRRGASAAVIPCAHSADLARSVLARGAWQANPAAATVLDGAAALLRFAASPGRDQGEQ